MEDIDPEVVTAVNEAFAYCQDHPDERVSAPLGTEEAAEDFLRQARSYAYHATPRLVVTGNVTQKGDARFTVDLWAG
jgi:ABC-type nitrate/sulfonate/bicarbonate transport system substrate-binding protein